MSKAPIHLWRRLTSGWYVLLEPPIPVDELSRALDQTSIPSFGFYLMLAFSTIIATVGLISNSTATIIGAMLIAPLMNPIVSLAFALVVGERKLLVRSIFTLTSGMVCVISIAYGISFLLGVPVVQSEILARTQPTLLDLIVAMAAGGAGGFVLTRRSIANSIVGVAIAVALVPPLSVVGIGLELSHNVIPGFGLSIGDEGLALGAALLFLTNLASIIFIASMVFLLQSYGNWKNAILGVSLWLGILLLISLPLGFSLRELFIRGHVRYSMSKLREDLPPHFEDIAGRSLSVELSDQGVEVEFGIEVPIDVMDRINPQTLQQFLTDELNRPVRLKLILSPIKTVESSQP